MSSDKPFLSFRSPINFCRISLLKASNTALFSFFQQFLVSILQNKVQVLNDGPVILFMHNRQISDLQQPYHPTQKTSLLLRTQKQTRCYLAR